MVNRAVSEHELSEHRRESAAAGASIHTTANSLKRRHIVMELTSSTTGAGKTHLMYLIVCMAILPLQWAGRKLVGSDSLVVVLDSDGRFNIIRLAEVIKSYVCRCEKLDKDELEDITHDDAAIDTFVEECLKHVHIFRPQSLSSVAESLGGLKQYLLNLEAHYSGRRQLHSVIVDSLSAFYWQQRALEENTDPSTSTSPLQSISKHLRSLQQQFNCSIIFTNTLPGSRARRERTGYISAIPGLIPTIQLAVTRKPVPLFPPMMSVTEAETDRRARQSAVEKGIFRVWSDNLQDGFWFKISSSSVSIGEEPE